MTIVLSVTLRGGEMGRGNGYVVGRQRGLAEEAGGGEEVAEGESEVPFSALDGHVVGIGRDGYRGQMDYAGHFAEEFRVVKPSAIACREVWRLLYSPQGEEKMEIGTELEVVGDSYHWHNSEGGE